MDSPIIVAGSALARELNLGREMVAFALILGRIMPIVVLVPFLGGKNAPTEVKMGVGATLWLIVRPSITDQIVGPNNESLLPLEAMSFVFMMLKETFVGLIIGFTASKIFYVVEIAGQLIDVLRGATQIQLVVPEIEERSSAFGSMQFQLLLALFLAMRLHEPFIEAFFESFRAIPINAFPRFQGGFWPFTEYLARLTAEVLYIAVLLAMPVGIVTLVTETVFGLINRVAPQINAYFMAMPAKVMGACLVFFLAIDIILEQMLLHSAKMSQSVHHVIMLME